MAHAAGTKPLVDLHVHGSENYDTRTRRQDDILRVAKTHGDLGTDAFLAVIYPGPIETMRANMEAVRRAMLAQQEGAKILGVYLEGPFLNAACAGALDSKSFLDPSMEQFTGLIAGFEEIVKIMAIAPELPGALRLIERCREKGILAHLGHSDATYEQAEDGKRAGATGITHIFNAMRGFHHREPGLAGFGLMDEDIYVEVIADLVHVHPQTLRMLFDMKPPEKIILISDSIKGPGWGSGAIRGAGGSLLGSGTPLSHAVKNLVQCGVAPDRALQFASDNPLQYLNITGF